MEDVKVSQAERLVDENALCVVVFWNDRYNTATVRPHHQRYHARATEAEVLRAGWESMRFGDLIVGELWELPEDGTVAKYELRNLREPTQEELDRR